MPNRRASTFLQVATIATLGGAWLLAKALRKRRAPIGGMYSIPPKPHIIASIMLLLADAYAIPKVLRAKGAIDAAEFGALNPGLVPRYDRHALHFSGEHAEHFRRMSDKVLQGIIAMPLLLLADPSIRADCKSVGTLYAWLHALTYTIYSFSPLGPAFVDKYRPLVYYSGLPEAARNAGNNRNARFSGHTAAGACATFFVAKVYCDYHRGMSARARSGLYLLAIAPPLLLGWLRMKALKHFGSDVLQAIVIGGCCGVMLPELYKNDV